MGRMIPAIDRTFSNRVRMRSGAVFVIYATTPARALRGAVAATFLGPAVDLNRQHHVT
jgi:hypothetical protein